MSHERKKENVMYSSIMPRHVWFGEASLLLRSSKPGIKYHIHYTHTAQDTAKAQVIDCCWWLCFFLYAGAGRGERGGGGVGIGSGLRADNPDLTFQGKFNCSPGGRGHNHKTLQLQCFCPACTRRLNSTDPQEESMVALDFNNHGKDTASHQQTMQATEIIALQTAFTQHAAEPGQ